MKIKFILHYFETRSGADQCFQITDTETGISLEGKSVPENNVRAVAYYLNNQQHQQNYYFATTQLSAKQYRYRTTDVKYIGSDPEEIADVFLAKVSGFHRDAEMGKEG